MKIVDVMRLLLEVPIEEHETTDVSVQICRIEDDTPLTQEEHDNLPYNYYFSLKSPDDDASGSL